MSATPVLGHVVMVCEEPRAAAAFLVAALGVTVKSEQAGGRYVEVTCPSRAGVDAVQVVALCHPETLAAYTGERPAAVMEGQVLLSFGCETAAQLAQYWQRALAAGGVVCAAPAAMPWGVTAGFIKSPFGGLIELYCPLMA